MLFKYKQLAACTPGMTVLMEIEDLFAFSSYTGKVKFEKLNAGSHFHPSQSTEYFLLYENLECGLRWSFEKRKGKGFPAT